MTPGAKLLAVENILSEVLGKVFTSNIAADNILKIWYRKNKYVGSKDRKEISNSLFGILKYYFILVNIINLNLKTFDLKISFQLVIIYYALIRNNYEYIINCFDDGPHAPNMNQKIFEYLKIIKNISLSKNYINTSFPDWLNREFLYSFKEDTNSIYASLLNEANIDLRVTDIYKRDKVYKKILKYDDLAIKTAFSPLGIRLSKRIVLKNIRELKGEFIEFQDEGSQLVTLLSGVKEGEVVLDLCAGAGGKTLLLASLVNNVKIIATDFDSYRLKNIKLRNTWIKYKNKIEIVDDYKNLNLLVDRVICDVPCSGSGSWRRRPEEKIRITKERFNDLLLDQKDILKKASKLLKVGGELVYITCSLLRTENEDQIECFIKNNSDFQIVDLKYSWDKIVKTHSWNSNNLFCQLLPNTNGCDGFFIALLRKFE